MSKQQGGKNGCLCLTKNIFQSLHPLVMYQQVGTQLQKKNLIMNKTETRWMWLFFLHMILDAKLSLLVFCGWTLRDFIPSFTVSVGVQSGWRGRNVHPNERHLSGFSLRSAASLSFVIHCHVLSGHINSYRTQAKSQRGVDQ